MRAARAVLITLILSLSIWTGFVFFDFKFSSQTALKSINLANSNEENLHNLNSLNSSNLQSKNPSNLCLTCHENYEAPSISHKDLSCIDCHDGVNSKNEKIAHLNLIQNPATLVNAKKKCNSCHANQVARVAVSPMQSQKPIRANLYEDWVEKATSHDLSKAELKALADNHFQRACNACHIDQKREVFENKDLAKGGGCVACHSVNSTNSKTENLENSPNLKTSHTKFTTQIPSSNCVRCHNRSARIGLSYFGKFESEGVKAPFDAAHTLADGRHYNELHADIHYQKAGLDCVDCHTSYGVMGDLKAHKNMREAVDISCVDCHEPIFKAPNETAKKLANLNPNLQISDNIAYTRKKNSPLYNVVKNGEKAVLYRKKDGLAYEITPLSNSPYHGGEIHKNLTCQSCHSEWMPSCYGCHEQYFAASTQYNWHKKEFEKGEWLEMRSFLRFESPALGERNDGKIAPFAPGCQVIGTVYDKNVSKFHSMSMASWDPHTTGSAKTCTECHFSSTALGFGRGNLEFENGNLKFSPYFEANATKFGFSYSIDAFVEANGTQNQHASKNDKALNKTQIQKIVGAYKCVICHDKWEDKIYENFELSKDKFNQGLTKCMD